MGPGVRLRGGVLMPNGRCKALRPSPLIYAIFSLYFFYVGLIFLLSSQATWQCVERWIEAKKSVRVDFVDFSPSNCDHTHVHNSEPLIT